MELMLGFPPSSLTETPYLGALRKHIGEAPVPIFLHTPIYPRKKQVTTNYLGKLYLRVCPLSREDAS